jgi:hypothetical protein
MVPVKEAVSSRAWLSFTADYLNSWDKENYQIKFRVKILSFSKINLDAVNQSSEIDAQYRGGIWWLMRLEVVNLCKKQIDADDFGNLILLLDQDQFEFEVAYDRHLCRDSEYAEKSGLDRLYAGKLLPKIKVLGAVAFYLPEEDDMEYFLAVKNGKVCEA